MPFAIDLLFRVRSDQVQSSILNPLWLWRVGLCRSGLCRSGERERPACSGWRPLITSASRKHGKNDHSENVPRWMTSSRDAAKGVREERALRN